MKNAGSSISRALEPGILRKLGSYVILVPFGLLFAFPFYWMFVTSLKTGQNVLTYPPKLIPIPISVESYVKAWSLQPFTLYTLNTLKIVISTVILAPLSSAVVAYGFARFKFRAKEVLFLLVLSTMIIPREVLLIPQYIEFRYMGWLNTYLPLIVPAAFGVPFFIFLIRQYVMSIPYELDEAARIEGATDLRVFWNVIVPLIVPALVTCGIFQFIWSWNDYLGPLIYLSSSFKWTLAMGVANLMQGYMTGFSTNVTWGERLAMSAFFAIGPLVVFLLAQKRLIGGISMSGIKG